MQNWSGGKILMSAIALFSVEIDRVPSAASFYMLNALPVKQANSKSGNSSHPPKMQTG